MKQRFCALLCAAACCLSLTACQTAQAPEPTPAPTPELTTPSPTPTPTPEPTPTPMPTPTSPLAPPEVPNNDLYVLMYHDVVADDAPCGPWSITESRFREDLQWLTDNGYAAMSVSELAAGAALPKRAVLITFDDGYASNCTLALPVLREFGMKAVVSLIAGYIDAGKPGFLTWDQCREMADSGFFEFGSHTYDCHSGGIARTEGETQLQYGARVFADLQKSIDRIERELDRPVQYFAYPHGKQDPWSLDFLNEHFAVTVTSERGVGDVSGGVHQLPRYNINMDDPPALFLPASNQQ